MSPERRFGVAMLPVAALYFYQAHAGRTLLPKWPNGVHLFYSVFYSVSKLRRACFRQVRATQVVLLPGALFHAEILCTASLCPKTHLCPLPQLGVFRKFDWHGNLAAASWALPSTDHAATLWDFLATQGAQLAFLQPTPVRTRALRLDCWSLAKRCCPQLWRQGIQTPPPTHTRTIASKTTYIIWEILKGVGSRWCRWGSWNFPFCFFSFSPLSF